MLFGVGAGQPRRIRLADKSHRAPYFAVLQDRAIFDNGRIAVTKDLAPLSSHGNDERVA